MPQYKAGKITEQLQFAEVLERVKAQKRRITREQLAYFWLLYYGGMRKSELYERTVGDCQITPKYFILELIRKKGSEQTDPLEFPLWFPGMDVVCEQLKIARKRRKIRKLLERWSHQKRITKKLRARWLFPHIHRDTALRIVKTVLGSNYYPHFLRLNRITEICSDPKSNLTRVKSFSGIKSTRIIEENYMGTSKREQKAAFDFMGKQIKKEKKKEGKEGLNESG